MATNFQFPLQRTVHDVRRQPFANTGNHMLPTLKPVSPIKAAFIPPQKPASPPLPRQNTKTTPPSPPQVIHDEHRAIQYTRVGFLGEGGFARVYEGKDKRGNRVAIKVVTKSSLKTKKAKTKLYAEIKIHRSLEHPNIVNFFDCFEDDDNVYMTLELCDAGSLMDMLRTRRRFTEPETRFFLVQLIGACNYMHSHQVIHRDLKLGNLFLDANMNIKVGDFGLAALIESPGERKKTICGTPNYIAPEVLFDTANGHSFEVDTWSIGVILYTLVVGRPPFQTKEVKEIYKRIRDNAYNFPDDKKTSNDVRDLIQSILTPDPQQRPTLLEILIHEFFTCGIVPDKIPRTAQDKAPVFKISMEQSKMNLALLRKRAFLDDAPLPGIAVPHPGVSAASGRSRSVNASVNSTVAIAQQEREFNRAVQPGSPISVLLGAARQPLVMAPASGAGRGDGLREREQPLLRKLQLAAKENTSPTRSTSSLRTSSKLAPSATEGRTTTGLQDIIEEHVEEVEEQLRQKALEAQKARIVAQMAAPASSRPDNGNFRQATSSPEPDDGEIKPQSANAPGQPKSVKTSTPASSLTTASGFTAFEASLLRNLTIAFDAKARQRLFRDPSLDSSLPEAKIFIVSWVDYCNKYGMGYALTDGSVGVHFNDSTSIVLAPDKTHFDYMDPKRTGLQRRNCAIAEHPEAMKSKVYLLKHFEKYIMQNLYGEHPFTFEDLDKLSGMDYVMKYLRTKHVIMFQLSHDVMQFNFSDHTKVILSSKGLVVTHINKDYDMTQWTLSQLMARALRPDADPVVTKFNTRLLEKLKYIRELLLQIKTANENAASGSSANRDDA